MAYPLPIFDLSLAPPGEMTLPYHVGGGKEGGVSLSGVSSSVDDTGGGHVGIKYSAIAFGNHSPRHLRYMSRLGAMLNGGVRPILVPLLTDFIVPTVGDAGNFSEDTFTDGTSFTDGTNFVDNAVVAFASQDASVGAGTLVVQLQAGVALFGGEWFSIAHSVKGQRAYCVTDVDGATANADGSSTYTIGVRPTLRQQTSAGTTVNFQRPAGLMRLEPGTMIRVDVKTGWMASPDVSFIEYFGA